MIDRQSADGAAPPSTRMFRGGSVSLRDVSDWVVAFGDRLALPKLLKDDVELCLNEVLANVLRHGRGASSDCEIVIQLEQLHGGVRVIISDDTPMFDPLVREAPPHPQSIMEATEGGYGIQLVRSLATHASYRWDNGRNVLSLDFQAV